MRTVHALFLPTLLVLGSCSEYVTNTGLVCLVPKDVECVTLYWDPPETFSEIPPNGFEYDEQACTGTYPADVDYEVVAYLHDGGGGYSKKEMCEVDVEGKHLDVTGHFWHGPERDAIVEPGATAFCSVGVLSAGTWTLEFGGNSMDVEIGDAEAIQDMICVESDKQHRH